jgi:hypothetical protein
VNNYLAAGSNVTIALMTDPASHGITQATFTVQLAGEEAKPAALTLPFSKSVPFLSVQDGRVIGTCEKSNISYGQVIPAAVGPIEPMSAPCIQQFGYVEPNLGTGGGSVAGGNAQKFGQPTHHIMADHLDVGAGVPGRP